MSKDLDWGPLLNFARVLAWPATVIAVALILKSQITFLAGRGVDWPLLVQFCIGIGWPVTVIAVALLFKSQLTWLAERLEEMQAGGATLKFRQGVRETKAKVATAIEAAVDVSLAPVVLEATATAQGGSSAQGSVENSAQAKGPPVVILPPVTSHGRTAEEALLDGTVRSLASVEPFAAIRMAWRGLEQSLKATAEQMGISYPPGQLRSVLKTLYEKRLVSMAHVNAYNDLRRLRKLASDEASFKPSVEDAVSYVDIAQGLAYHLYQIFLTQRPPQ